jgi:tetratricopeptide (TPR) repeat protein
MTQRCKAILVVLCLTFVARTASAEKHDTWVEVRSPHFIVVSNAGEKQARQTAVHFEQVRSLFREMITIAQNAPSPTITIFAVKNEGSLRELLPEYWVKGHMHPAGIFFGRRNQFYAAVRLDVPGDNPYMTLYHEYYHSLTLPYFPGLPLWLAEGFADFFGNAEINDKEAIAGRASPELIEELKQGSFIPLNVLFSVDHSSPYYNEENKTSEFYAESWALVHYLMMGDNAAHRQSLVNYLAAIDHGATAQEAATKAFGDLGKLQKTLQAYIGGYQFYELRGAAPPRISDASLQVRTLSEAELDAEMGGFAAARGRTQEAKPLLEEAVRLDPKLALARQNLALVSLDGGDSAGALASASEAVALDPKNALTRYLRAYLTVTAGGMMAHNSQVEDDLRQSIAMDPDFAPPYALLALYLATDEDNLTEALSFARKAVSIEPGTAGYQVDLAQVLLRMRRYDDARIAVLRARADAIAPQERAQADQLLAVVEQVRGMDTSNRDGQAGAPDASSTRQTRDAAASVSGTQPGDGGAAAERATQEVTGIVTKVSCNPAIELQVTAADKTYDLYTLPGQQTKFEASSQPPAGFNPCSTIKGLRVSVQYVADDAKTQKGKIAVLRILGWESQ